MPVWLFLIIFFCFPYVLWVFQWFEFPYISSISQVNWSELAEALGNSILQGAIASLVSLLLGIVLFLSIHSFKRGQTQLAIVAMLPFLMPALYILSMYFSVTSNIVFGNIPVGLAHGYVLAGYTAYNLWNSYHRYWIRFEQVSLIFNVSRVQHWWNIIKLQKSEIVSSIILAMLLGVTSFAIPLTLGGASGGNLELLIFQKLKYGESVSDLNVAVLIQVAIIVVFEFLRGFINSNGLKQFNNFHGMSLQVRNEFRFSYMRSALILYIGVLFIPLIYGFIYGIRAILRIDDFARTLGPAFLNSLNLYGLTFIVIAIVLCLLSYSASLHSKLWIKGFMFPLSASILAYLLWNMPFVPDLMKLLYVYCLIFIPFLFRFGIQERIRLLDDQVFVSQSLGASHFRTWRYVVYPQIKHEIYVLASIGAFWCLLDFAIIKLFISEANYSLALTAQNWLASYRYYEAQGLIVMLTIWGIFMILGVHRALDRDI